MIHETTPGDLGITDNMLQWMLSEQYYYPNGDDHQFLIVDERGEGICVEYRLYTGDGFATEESVLLLFKRDTDNDDLRLYDICYFIPHK